MAIFIKNASGSQQTWVGKVLDDAEVYEIPATKEAVWSSDSDLLVAIISGDAVVSKDDSGTTDITDINQAVNYLKNIPNKQDSDGVPLSRTKITQSSWHYQAHSVQFEVNKLGSIYNKDCDGNDLGFTEIKIYDDQGAECTTQGSADTSGVKTVVTWKPDFDFEVISGNVRQQTKETVDSYVYVNAVMLTGLAAPYDWIKLPFVQGGVNLNYIGADEPLKTDGRTAKLVKGSLDEYFEVVVNYEADLLTNENRHKMSLIFEIYKDPAT